MKLLLCRICQDVFKISIFVGIDRKCNCGAIGGRYLNDLDAEYWGGKNAIPIGFSNSSLAEAVKKQPDEGLGERFEAFVIPKKCPTMKMVDKPK